MFVFQVYRDDKIATCICFHCSQTLDNFHNFATKIKAIQNIIFPEQHVEIEEISYEICVIPTTSEHIEEKEPIRTETYEVVKENDNELEPSDGEEWSPVETSHKIPSKLLENGALIYKGEELMTMMSQFFNTSCDICSKPFKRINELFRHHKLQHSITPYISCCSSKLTKTPAIIWH